MEKKALCKEITRFLTKLGTPQRVQGFHLIRDILVDVIAYNDEKINLSRIYYPSISHKHSISTVGVERSVRYGIKLTWEQSRNTDLMKDIFGYDNIENPYQPSNREFLFAVANYLRFEVLS